jgi:CBS domain-containing protein
MEDRSESTESLDAVITRALTNTALAQRKVAELMTRAIRAVRPDQTIQDAIDVFAGQEFHHIPVTDGAALVGVISDRDVLRALLRSQTTVDGPIAKIMRSEPFTTGPDATISEATRLLLGHHINSLPVVDRTGALVGMLTTTDLLRGLLATAAER